MRNQIQISLCTALIFSFTTISSVSSAIISSQEGEIQFLDSHDQVIKLYKQVFFNSHFDANKNDLDTSINSPNPKNPIKCFTQIVHIGSDQVSDKGIAIQTYATFITNDSFYVVYDTYNSPTRISSLTVRWTCFKSDDVYLFDFQYDSDQQEGQKYKQLEYLASNGTQLGISSLGALSNLATSFLASGFSITSSSNIQLNVKIVQNASIIQAVLAGDNLQQINKVYGKILVSSKDNCSLVSISHPSSSDIVSQIHGDFDTFTTKHYTSIYGIGGFSLNQIQISSFSFDLQNYSVNYSGGSVKGVLVQQNGQVDYSNIVCKIDDLSINDSPVDILVGSLTIIFGIIIYLSTTLLYMKKKKEHIILDDQHAHQVYTDHDHSHTHHPIAQKL
ncbi:transmembrane protein, putative (macronuclear) [Tetrahymena thermophila SB210]|uniref:Transmembrane protein, putative n=1 Tax=Tetrahymena thermophila (strain SB210) TaxID=312017 RepID=I7MM98_TETTS|nr:transmembrane protein, putative [Tetrahymena thermophila SB210]EAS04428.1 transmembrane protein, putative [Tetrahymena thermophila SB210]|eukprot:XP_001024673.1 transmembrane protein, putative [Tetrahymena thermophila SB210]